MTQPNPRLSSLFKLEYPQSVGVYNTYDEAQKVVDFLADARFPVENLCIVGTELRSVERVLGRRSWRTVIGQGVQSGVSTGLMIALLMWLFVPTDNPLLLALYALGIGIIVGIGMAALGYWMSQGKRDFTSVSQTIATKYEVLAEHKVVGKARELVTGMPGARAAQFNPAGLRRPLPAPATQAPGYGQQAYGRRLRSPIRRPSSRTRRPSRPTGYGQQRLRPAAGALRPARLPAGPAVRRRPAGAPDRPRLPRAGRAPARAADEDGQAEPKP